MKKIFLVTIKGNDIFTWTNKVEAKDIGTAIENALAWIDGFTIEQFIEVRAVEFK